MTPEAAPAASGVETRRMMQDRRYAWIVLVVLTFIYSLNFLDRQLLSILAKPIQDELGVTDGQIGLLGGLYFALFYCVLGVPVAWLADRYNRIRVLVFACTLWSAATVACGMASSYPQLAAARMSVGIGEAGGAPPSYSIISDYFAPSRRGRALSFFNLAPPVGQAFGVAFGAQIALAHDWRTAFYALGGIGLCAALAAFLIVREPKRGATDPLDAAPPATGPAPTIRGVMKLFVKRRPLILVALAAGATQFITYGILNFSTLFLMREKGMTLGEIAVWFALMLGVVVTGGIYASGWLIDRFTGKSPQSYGLIPAATLTLSAPFFIGFVSAPGWPAAMGFLAVTIFLCSFYLTPAVALVQNVMPANQRTLGGAVLLLVMNLIGLGLGPTFVGAMSDWFAQSNPANSLQMAFYALLPVYGLAIGLYLALAQAFRREAVE